MESISIAPGLVVVPCVAVSASGDRPGRGRPRDPTKDGAVLEATIRALASEGLTRLTMDRVAAAAGVSKVTVYKRFGSKDGLIGAALAHLQLERRPDETGSVRDDLVAHLDAMRRQYEEVGGMAVIGNCLAEEPTSGALLDTIRASTLLPRRARFAEVVRAGVARGELAADVDVERTVSLLVGTLYADHLAGRALGTEWAAAVVDVVLTPLLVDAAG